MHNLQYRTEVTTAPDEFPVSLEAVKTHLRLHDFESDEDELLIALIGVAREYVQAYTRRVLNETTYTVYLDRFPFGNFRLPVGPVTSINSVKYYDGSGTLQTVDTSIYKLGKGDVVRPNIVLKYGMDWPSDVLCEDDSVEIEFVAGYADIPFAARAAIMLIVAHLYENREESTDQQLKEIPFGVKALLDTIRNYEPT